MSTNPNDPTLAEQAGRAASAIRDGAVAAGETLVGAGGRIADANPAAASVAGIIAAFSLVMGMSRGQGAIHSTANGLKNGVLGFGGLVMLQAVTGGDLGNLIPDEFSGLRSEGQNRLGRNS